MTHKIKTFEQACKALKLNPKSLPKVEGLHKKHKDAIISHYKLIIVAEALNDGWKPNWSDTNEVKFFPYFEHKSSGVSFNFSHVSYYFSYVGSRLCYKSRELSDYAGKQFIKLYNTYFTLPK